MTRKAVLMGLAMAVGFIGLGPAMAAAQSTVASLNASKPAPQMISTTITFTATATGGTPPYQTKWFVTVDNWKTWTVAQDWSPSMSFSWTPGTAANYIIGFWVRSANNQADKYDDLQASGTMSFPIGFGLTLSGLTADKVSPQPPGLPVTFTAKATGGAAPYQTKWFVTANNWKTWTVAQDWSPTMSFPWSPGTEGNYFIGVWIRSASNPADSFDSVQASGTTSFTIVLVCPPTNGVPPDQDVKRGQCLFNSSVAFNQADPTNVFASCSGCHPGGGTDRGTHPVMITTSSGTFIGVRQVPNLRNVTINLPLGWDGRHGGTPGDMASIKAAIQSAAKGAINSPVEMAGSIDPTTNPADQDKLDALTAFLISRSPTQPRVPGPSEQRAVLDVDTANNVRSGAAVFFGRSASTQALFAQGKACVSCHPPPAFTDNKVRSNILTPGAAWDFGFPQPGGGIGPQDHGAGLTTVTDPTTGRSVQVGTFKTPSLHHFYPDGQPSLHNGIFAEDGRLFRFYEKSLGFKLAPGESTGLHYWLVNCPKGIGRPDSLAPVECF